MQALLRKQFILMLTPAISGFLCAWIWRLRGGIDAQTTLATPVWAAAIFVAAVFTAAAGPVLLRALFAHRMRDRRQTPPDQFLRFQQQLLAVVMVTPYLALAAYLLAVPGFYLGGTLLMMLYALYYHYPSVQRLAFDHKVFRVK